MGQGRVIVFTGPSGVGKGTLLRELLAKHPEVFLSISATTRTPRPGEIDGRDYYFLDREDFVRLMKAGEFLEWAEFASSLYGTPRQAVLKQVQQGKLVVLEIELAGARQVRQTLPEALQVFVLPPSLAELEQRIRNRGTEPEAAIQQRLQRAQEEIAAASEFDVCIVNDDLQQAIYELDQVFFPVACSQITCKQKTHPLPFDAAATEARVEKFWQLSASFGMERNAYHNYLNEIVSDRYTLINGLQILRDELQLAASSPTDMKACGADMSLPSVVTTLAYTNCGDRIHQGEATKRYRDVVASRFATLSEIGELKLEAFFPAGGGTDNGATLAHVTVAHELDESLKRRVYEGNPQSISLVAIDLKTHVGRLRENGQQIYGKTRESPWREPRDACGAIVGALTNYHPENLIHRRIRNDLGELNFQFLSSNSILTDDGVNITMAVAANIVAIRGIRNTAMALAQEMDERGLAHLTASTTVNRPSRDDLVIYLARATVFNGRVRIQSLGTEAELYGGMLVEYAGEQRLQLRYADWDCNHLPIEEISYQVRLSGL